MLKTKRLYLKRLQTYQSFYQSSRRSLPSKFLQVLSWKPAKPFRNSAILWSTVPSVIDACEPKNRGKCIRMPRSAFSCSSRRSFSDRRAFATAPVPLHCRHFAGVSCTGMLGGAVDDLCGIIICPHPGCISRRRQFGQSF